MSIRSGKYNIKRAEIPGDEPGGLVERENLKPIKWGFSYTKFFQIFFINDNFKNTL